MNTQTKAALDSYLRNLLGVVLALITTTMASSGIASPLDFGLGEWLGVANGLWAAAVPTLIRYVNKKDPAFGLVAAAVAAEVTKKIEVEVEKAKPVVKPVAKKTTASTAKAAEEKIAKVKADAERMAELTRQAQQKTPVKKTTPKKSSGGGGDASPQQIL